MFCCVDGPVNALSIGPGSSLIVIGGINVLKIFSIEDDGFVERCNLRVGRHMNLNYSSLDVAWHPSRENIIASASTNRAVVIWDLDKISKSKISMVYTEHKRTVNKVCFNPADANYILSGSLDGSVRCFDFRVSGGAEKIFVCSGSIESIRDIQFDPTQEHLFAAADDGGYVRLWDFRRPDRFLSQFGAHSGPIFGMDFHPTQSGYLATAGRDKLIKIWPTKEASPPVNERTVQTIAPVSKIRWRHTTSTNVWQLASCSLVSDLSIYVWDIRRPFIPVHCLDDHSDVTTGIVWHRGDSNRIISCSKDCTLRLHKLSEAKRLEQHVNPAGLDVNAYGNVCVSMPQSTTLRKGYQKIDKIASFGKAPSLDHRNVLSSLTVCNRSPYQQDLNMDWFVISAKQYRLTGKGGQSTEDLCTHNADVAKGLDRHHVAQTWLTIRDLYCTSAGPKLSTKHIKSLEIEGERGRLSMVDMDKNVLDQLQGNMAAGTNLTETETNSESELNDPLGQSDRGGLFSSNLSVAQTPAGGTFAAAFPGAWSSDYFFGDGDLGKMVFDEFETYGRTVDSHNFDDWTLPSEAFQPRVDVIQQSSSTGAHMTSSSGTASVAQTPLVNGYAGGLFSGGDVVSCVGSPASLITRKPNPSDKETQKVTVVAPQVINVVNASHIKNLSWDHTSFVREMLIYLASQGDVQTPVSILLVFKDKLKDIVDVELQELWYHRYVELLSRFRLFTISALIIKLCPLPSIHYLSHQSTQIIIGCERCGRAGLKCGWFCQRCKAFLDGCSVCRKPVFGLYTWCKQCGHGGHLSHLEEWFQSQQLCPSGCGDRCILATSR